MATGSGTSSSSSNSSSSDGTSDLLASLLLNGVLSVAFLICFAFLKNQPVNLRVYFPRWFVTGLDERVEEFVLLGDGKDRRAARYVNLNWKSYFHVMDWVWSNLRYTEAELIRLVGLDSVVFLRIFLLGLKVFVPMMLWGCVVLIPVNKTDNYLASYQTTHPNVTYSSIDTLSISNVTDGSKRLWAHLVASYLFTCWTCFILYLEYSKVEKLRFEFIADQKQRPDQFTVLVRQVPRDKNQSVGMRIQEFFRENHPEHYVTHQVVYEAKKLSKLIKKKEKYQGKLDRMYQHLSAEPAATRPTVRKSWYKVKGEKLDAIDYYEGEVDRLEEEIKKERKIVLSEQKYVMRAGFVSFNSRWGAAVCAQTQQSKDHTKWLTEWAPEPRDVYWNNLAIQYMMLNSRRLLVSAIVFLLVFFYLIPIAFVQSLANLDELNKYLPFLKPITNSSFVSFFQGYLPGLVLKICLLLLPLLLKTLTKYEGHISWSKIDKYAAIKYQIFMVVNVFFGNILLGSLFEQLKQYIAAPTTIPKAFGLAIPMKATFFMTYIMLDGWTSIAAEILRLWPMAWYHIRNTLFVRTDKERMKVIPATPPQYNITLPRISLYFLLGLVYAVISPIILPFICVYFAFGYLIYRNQVINVYEPMYESAASFWPYVHRNLVVALVIKHITLIGLFSVKNAVASTPFLIPLPILTIMFHVFCTQKFYLAFKNYPLQEAKRKDNMEPEVDVKNFLETAYLHPSITLAADIDSDTDNPDTVKNGTAPNAGRDNDSTTPGPKTDNPDSQTSSRRIQQEGSDSNTASFRRSNRVHADVSPAFMEAGSYLSSPNLSRGSSHRVHLEGSSSLPHHTIAGNIHGSARSSSFRSVDVVGRELGPVTKHKASTSNSPDSHSSKHHHNSEIASVAPNVPGIEGPDTARSVEKDDKKPQRNVDLFTAPEIDLTGALAP